MFTLPTFNLTVNVWTAPAAPPAAPTFNVACQLRGQGNRSSGQDSTLTSRPFLWLLLVPKLTDLRDGYTALGADIVECPAGSGRYYDVEAVDDVAKGFLNEYRLAVIRKRGTWAVPIP